MLLNYKIHIYQTIFINNFGHNYDLSHNNNIFIAFEETYTGKMSINYINDCLQSPMACSTVIIYKLRLFKIITLIDHYILIK